MTYQVTWNSAKSIILVKLSGDMDITEFPEFDKLILKHVAESDRPLVHIWVDLLEVTQFPTNVRQVHKALTHKNHPRIGWTVLITKNRIFQFVGYMITQLAKARFRAFSTEEEAQSFLKMMDQEVAGV